MYAVAGVSGQTGAATARALLAQNLPVRVIVRDAEKGKIWTAGGAEVVIADLANVTQLTAALNGSTAAYLLNPPAYAAENPFEEAERYAEVYAQAIDSSDVKKVVVLSSISAHLAKGNGIIHTNYLFEKRLSAVAKPVNFLRPSYFYENWSQTLAPVYSEGILPSMLSPLDRAIPMVAVDDIGALAARLLQQSWTGCEVVELTGPAHTSPDAVAAAIAFVLGRDITALAVPRDTWNGIFAASGMSARTIDAFVAMFDGFNNGTIRFEGSEPHCGTSGIVAAARSITAEVFGQSGRLRHTRS